MGKISKNKEFLRALERVMAQAKPQSAPTHFADRVLDRWREEPSWSFALPAGLAMACAAALLLFVVGRQFAQRPEIVSFGFDKPTVNLREPITLRWQVKNVERVQIKVKYGGVLKEVEVTEPVASDSITLMLHKPGKYSFELIAHTPQGVFSRSLGRR